MSILDQVGFQAHEYTEDSFKIAARLREEMAMSEQVQPKTITIPVVRTVVIDILENQMVVCNGTFCGGAEAFHEVLRARMDHPFSEAPKPKRTRGPNQPKQDSDPRVTVVTKKVGK